MSEKSGLGARWTSLFAHVPPRRANEPEQMILMRIPADREGSEGFMPFISAGVHGLEFCGTV